MYKIYLDGNPLFFTGSEDLKLRNAKLDSEVNRFGSLTFTIGKENPMYSRIRKKESKITAYDDKKYVFGGRVLDAKKDFFGAYTVTCEGKIGYLKDSVVRPYSFEGSVADYFKMLITQHNNQVGNDYKFQIGNVTVTDPNDFIVRSNQNYPDTWVEIDDKLIKKLGGYVVLRQEGTAAYLDYLKDSEFINEQEIHFGQNLLENEFEESVKGKDIYTCIIPLGEKLKDQDGNETGERLTIKEVNGGLDYVYDESAVQKHGKIYKVVTYDDVTLPENLLARGRKELQNTINLIQTVKLSAVDLHSLNANIKSFELFKYTRVVSEYHGLNKTFLTRKLSLDLLDPTKSYLVLGDEKRTFVDKTVDTSNNVNGIIIEGGVQGPQGPAGADGKDGTDGRNGIDGHDGKDGLPGKNGANGKDGVSTYSHIAWANNSTGTDGFSTTVSVGKTYIGMYVDEIRSDSNDPKKYHWSLIKGADGTNGTPGKDGKNGSTAYLHIAYANKSSDGQIIQFHKSDSTGRSYIGQYTDHTEADSDDSGKYTWALMKGADGKDGTDGRNGIDGHDGKDGVDGQDANKMYISSTPPEDKTIQWCDTNTDPPVLKEWGGNTWVAVPDQSNVINLIFKTAYAYIEKVDTGLKSYVGEKYYTKDEAGELGKLVSEQSTTIKQEKDRVNMEFVSFRSELGTTNDNVNTRFEEVHKYIRAINGVIYIGIEGNPLILKLANDRISFLENGAEVMYINNNKLFITEVEITSTLRIGNLAFVPRQNGNLMLKKVK